ncbi:permease-like cell division protein FtsX [Streptosporangium sp. NPDC023615]|uniref:permease-like cell division protein FtsX n=1 Tax=Streptosporangium sp. NPDC023615 TaxID=3154794 RepID=UPI003420A930
MSDMAPSGTPEVAVFLCKDGDPFPGCEGGAITRTERENLRRALEARPETGSVVFQDRQQAWENFRRANKDDHKLLRAVAPEDMPESFRARIRAGADFSAVARAASELPGVSNSVNQACLLDGMSPWGLVKHFLGVGERERCSIPGKGR